MDSTEFEYRPTIKKIYWALVVLTILALLILVRVNLSKLTTETYIFTAIKLLIAVIVPLSILFRLQFFVRPYIFSKYKLQENLLFIKFKKKEKKVNLDNVMTLSFTLFSPRFFGGFKIKTDDGFTYRFLSLLQNNHKIVEYLAHAKPDLKTESKFKKYIQTSKTVLISWRRILIRIKKWPYLLVKFLVLPGLFFLYTYKNIHLENSRFFSQMEKLGVLLFAFFMVNFLTSFFYNHFEELILNTRTKDKSDEDLENWDFASENVIFYGTQIVFLISSGLCLYVLSKSVINIFAPVG